MSDYYRIPSAIGILSPPYYYGQKGIPKMRVFVTGVGGQLGHDMMNELAKRGHDPIGSDIAPHYSGIQDGTPVTVLPYISLDITDEKAVNRVIYELNPDAIIHCAAWTAVDAAEDIENQEKVRNINVNGTAYLAHAASRIDAKMVYLSTDYVFDGQGDTPWNPEDKNYSPLNVYGESKLSGEKAVAATLKKYFIVRIAWVFGQNGNNFIKTMLNVAKTHDHLKVVSDQIGTPTYTYDLAVLLADMLETERYGYYHATNEGEYISWYDFAKEIFHQAAALGHPEYSADRLTVDAVTTEEYGVSKAKRPFNSRLNRSKLAEEGFTPLPDWKDALARYLNHFTDWQ